MYFINMCTNEKKNLCFWKGGNIWSNIYIYNYFPIRKPRKMIRFMLDETVWFHMVCTL